MWILILCLIFLFLIFADSSISVATDTIAFILYHLLPSLFPFFVLTNMLSHSGKIALLTGFLCGYPAGAIACAQLYKNGTLSKEEANRYTMFTNNAGPTFIVGAIGISMCASKAIGFLLLGVHFVAAATVAIIAWFRFPQRSKHQRSPMPQIQSLPFGTQLTQAITIALKQIAVVCGYVFFFSVLLSLLQRLGLKNSVLFSLMEITTGMNCLLTPLRSPASMPALLAILPVVAMLLGFSGLSIHAQIVAILNHVGLPARHFIIGKILQALFSGLYTLTLLQIPVIYKWLSESSLTVSASADFVTNNQSFHGVQLLLIEIILAFSIYIAEWKKKLKLTTSL